MQEKPGILYDQLNELISSMGFTLVDVSGATVNGTFQVRVIIFSHAGIGTVECAQVSRALLPRLELLYNSREIALEVGSPGLERKFSSFQEFRIFTGRVARVYTDDWKRGIIKNYDGETIEMQDNNKTFHIYKDDVVKAQLVFQEIS